MQSLSQTSNFGPSRIEKHVFKWISTEIPCVFLARGKISLYLPRKHDVASLKTLISLLFLFGVLKITPAVDFTDPVISKPCALFSSVGSELIYMLV